MSEPRVRFAPSPTGYLHIGGVRTALYNWLFARHEGGDFILRIEDTDRERSTDEAVRLIIDGMRWVGLDWDEGPYFQSRRLEVYREYAEKLLSKGAARMDSLGRTDKGEAVVFPVTKRDVVYDDIVKGRILRRADDLEPHVVLVKSDGFPTYNFGCVVDDVTMRITHVIRGDDHVANTWKQILLYEALEEEPPLFAHLPMIHNEKGQKLSKRDGALAVTDYRRMGFLPEALMNFLALLGWSPGGDVEVMSRQELIRSFDLRRVKTSASRFDLQKLRWMNRQHLQRLPQQEIVDRILPTLDASEFVHKDLATVTTSVSMVTTRMTTLADFKELAGFALRDDVKPDEKARKLLEKQSSRKALGILLPKLEGLTHWTPEAVETIVREVAEEAGLKLRDVAQPLRAAVAGSTASPGIGATLEMVDKERSLKRIREQLEEAK